MISLRKLLTPRLVFLLTLLLASAGLSLADAPKLGDQKTFAAPHHMQVAVIVNAPYLQAADLQIVCILKHDSAGDQYLEAMKDFDDKLGNALSTLRNRGDFIGERGETLLLDPGSAIPAKHVMLIGVGAAADLNLDALKLAGRIAAREAVRLHAKSVAWAPTLRDQGSSVIDVGAGDAAFAEDFLLAYDAEKRLQKQNLAPPFDIDSCTIEAGTKYFADSVEKVAAAVTDAISQVAARDTMPAAR